MYYQNLLKSWTQQQPSPNLNMDIAIICDTDKNGVLP